jgi:hypothetical protein
MWRVFVYLKKNNLFIDNKGGGKEVKRAKKQAGFNPRPRYQPVIG